jgi:indole-3-glycerol phosphate synthase
MNILEKILQHKQQEVAERKKAAPVATLESASLFGRKPFSARQFMRERSGIIAEIKRKSPSKGMIHEHVDIPATAAGYDQAGVSAISVLTDEHFFAGANRFLTASRERVACPILRKDFIIDEYQVIEAKAIGADLILLIAAALSPQEIGQLADLAVSLELEVLLEVHDREELERSLHPSVHLLGVNNRNLKTFEVTLETSEALAEHIPNDFIKVSESGIRTPEDVFRLQKSGFEGFLIGENFMQAEEPAVACRTFIEALKNKNAHA